MYSKEESKLIKQEFWTSFGKYFPRKWLLYNTKIKGFSFKFQFENKRASVVLDLEDDLENRINYWEKLQSLKSILIEDFLSEAVFKEEYFLNNGKEISRISVTLDQKVSIHNKTTWHEVMQFFNEKMSAFEAFFYEYEDFIKA